MERMLPSKNCKVLILSLALFQLCIPVLSPFAFGAIINLHATWTPNTEADMAGYNLYRTDGTRTKINSALIPHPPTLPYPFSITVTDGSKGTATFVLRAMDKDGYESADSNMGSYNYDLSKVTLSGYVRGSDNVGISGVTMTGISITPPKTDANGYYTSTISYGWSGTVTPSKSGYTFSPASRSYGNVVSNQTNQNYTGTPATVTISGNAGVAGATLSYTDGSAKTAAAGSTGNYSFNVSYNWSGTVTPSKSGYTFNPASRSYSNVVSSQTNQNYAATIQGNPFIQVTSPNGGENLLVGKPYTITWNSAYLNPGGTLYLFYSYDGAWHLITNLPTGASSYSWTIPRIPAPVTTPKPSGHVVPASLWIGNWVNGKWECYDKNDYKFRILYDGWLGKISAGDQGGATITLDSGIFDGYGISLELGMFRIEGAYSIDSKGRISGTHMIYAFDNPANVFSTGNVTGTVDQNSKKLTLRFAESDGTPVFKLSGIRLPAEPIIPQQWAADLSGSANGKLTSLQINSFKLGSELYSYMYEFLGSGSLTGGSPIHVTGYFYLTSPTANRSNKIYGIYRITETGEIGNLTGSLNFSKGTIKFDMSDSEGHKYSVVGNTTQ